jgi:hypothetical protein
MKLRGEHSCSGTKSVPVPLRPTEISQTLAWYRTLTSAVAGETGLNEIKEFTYQLSNRLRFEM